MNYLKILMILLCPVILLGSDSAPSLEPNSVKHLTGQETGKYRMIAQVEKCTGETSSSPRFSLTSFTDLIEPDVFVKRDINLSEIDMSLSKTSGVDNLPSEFSLGNNYPNPFNSSTIIDYALPEASHVTIEVYNVLGQRVETLVDEYKEAGYHSVSFGSTNLATGMYLYRIQANEFSKANKMLIVK